MSCLNGIHILVELNKSHSLNSLARLQEIPIIVGVITLVILENSIFHLENSSEVVQTFFLLGGGS